jgi:predicted nucleotidyltransferase
MPESRIAPLLAERTAVRRESGVAPRGLYDNASLPIRLRQKISRGFRLGPSVWAFFIRGKEAVVKKEIALRLLREGKAHVAREFGVTRLALFGSVARDEADEDSDVDIVVRFDGPATSKRYFGVQFYLEDLLGRPVDLVTDKALRPDLRPYIKREAIDV